MQERLDKFLASQGLGTRKEVSGLIRSGVVTVNGERAKSGSQKLDPDRDLAQVDGVPVAYQKHLTLMMNKPAGVLSATEDPHSKTVLDLLPPEFRRRGQFPAGRLDKDTTGLLLITDDGDLAHRMLSPKSHVYKLYEAALRDPVRPEDIEAFWEGVSQGGQSFAPARLWTEPREWGEAALVEIREGKFHQVKRMFQAVGNQVLRLKRLKRGGLWLDKTLGAGEARPLAPQEIDLIFTGNLYQKEEKHLDFIENS